MRLCRSRAARTGGARAPQAAWLRHMRGTTFTPTPPNARPRHYLPRPRPAFPRRRHPYSDIGVARRMDHGSSPHRPSPALTAIPAFPGFLAGCAQPIAEPAPLRRRSRIRAQRSTVVVDRCSGQQQTRPSSFILTCAYANAALTGCSWAICGGFPGFRTLYREGQHLTSDCAEGGKTRLLSAPDTLWRPEPSPPTQAPLLHQDHQGLPGHRPPLVQLPRQTRLLSADQHITLGAPPSRPPKRPLSRMPPPRAS